MVALILGGDNKKNAQWIEQISLAIGHLFDDCVKMQYEHWNTENAHIDFNIETARLEQIRMNYEAEDVVIVAKSAGVVLGLKAIAKEVIRPKKCVFIGTPIGLDWIDKVVDVKQLINNNDYQTLYIQNSKDPITSFKTIKKTLLNNSIKSQLICIESNTHEYENYKKIINHMKDFFTSVE